MVKTLPLLLSLTFGLVVIGVGFESACGAAVGATNKLTAKGLKEQLDREVLAVDKNGDGTVSKDEIGDDGNKSYPLVSQLFEAVGQPSNEVTTKALNEQLNKEWEQGDKNGDGVIDEADIAIVGQDRRKFWSSLIVFLAGGIGALAG